jgi:hypothetical protein
MAEFAEMSDPTPMSDPTQLYTAIEKAYCEDRWSDVLDQGEKLLSQLPAEDLDLRQRLQLLMAHTFLYGYGDRDSAEDFYRAVHGSKAEASLRQIAANGLEQCHQPPARLPRNAALDPRPSAAAEPRAPVDPDGLPQPVDGPTLGEEGVPNLHDAVAALSAESGPSAADLPPVMPWLTTDPATERPGTPAGTPAPRSLPWQREASLPQTSEELAAAPTGEELDDTMPELETLIADVIDEPEMIEVHQADPVLAEEFELQEMDTAPVPVPEAKTMESTSAAAALEPAAEPVPSEEDPELLGCLLRVEIV